MPDFDESFAHRAPPYPELLDLTKRLLAKASDDRPSTAQEILQSLLQLQARLDPSDAVPLHGYVASALTGLSSEVRERVALKCNKVAEVCRELEIYVYQPRKATDPTAHPDVSPTAVYRLDRQRVLAADLLIIIADVPSMGVGQEIEIAGAFGTPTILVTRSDGQVSRMVTGSHLNLVDHIQYSSPEEFERNLREAISRHIVALRTRSSQRAQPGIPLDFVARLEEARDAAGLTVQAAATRAGISESLLSAIEREAVAYHNVGLHAVGRLLNVYGITWADLLGSHSSSTMSPATGVEVQRIDGNLRRLEETARKYGWTASDLLELRDEYQKERAASGARPTVSPQDWAARRQAIEQRKMVGTDGSLKQGELI